MKESYLSGPEWLEIPDVKLFQAEVRSGLSGCVLNCEQTVSVN